MKLKLGKLKLLILIALILVALGALVIVAINTPQKRHIQTDPTEEYIDSIIEYEVNSEPRLDKKPLIRTVEGATNYARMLYLENYGEWDDEREIWVKHYKKYGVWFAMLRSDRPSLDGPPVIIFQDTDGKVIYYAS